MKKLFYRIASKKDVKNLEKLLPLDVLKHCQKYKNVISYEESIFTYFTLINMLNELNISYDRISFSNNGKPLISNGYISISHSKDFCLVSYSEVNHGVDIQFHKEIEFNKIINKYFKDKELIFSHLSKKEQTILFYELWTRKESIVKLNDSSIFILDKYDNYFSKINKIADQSDEYTYSITTKEDVEYVEL